jgi:hypothetical protein
MSSWDGGRFIKEDGCGVSKYEGENLDVWDGIFCFEGGFEVARVWMVLVHSTLNPRSHWTGAQSHALTT